MSSLDAWLALPLLRQSGTAYMLVNAAHILGLGLLIGAILPLDLRLVGLFRAAPLAVIGPFLSRAAAAGLALALATGALLFTVRPSEYFSNPAFLAKLGLLGFALVNVALQHAGGLRAAFAEGVVPAGARIRAGASLLLWLAVLVAGRAIGFV